MKKLVILRGLPGSGKTRAILEILKEHNYLPALPEVDARIAEVSCSADHHFENKGDYGEYIFNPAELGRAHMLCQAKALDAMAAGKPLVIIDNTNTRHWEYYIYQRMGDHFGYEIEVRCIGGTSMEDVRKYAARNVHGVPELKILEMAYRWEE